MTPVTRREAVRRLAGAGAGLALGDVIVRGQSAPMLVAGKRVEIVVSSISDATVRITALPVDGGRIPGRRLAGGSGRRQDRRASRIRNEPNDTRGQLSIGIASTPPTIQIDTRAGKPVQRLTLDAGVGGYFLSARQRTAARHG